MLFYILEYLYRLEQLSLLYWKNLKSKHSLKFEKNFFFEHHVSIQKFSDFREFQVLDFFFIRCLTCLRIFRLSVYLCIMGLGTKSAQLSEGVCTAGVKSRAFHMLAGTLLWSCTPQPRSVCVLMYV